MLSSGVKKESRIASKTSGLWQVKECYQKERVSESPHNLNLKKKNQTNSDHYQMDKEDEE